jgi:hypothetical protein
MIQPDSSPSVQTIPVAEFESRWRTTFSHDLAEKVSTLRLQYRRLTQCERDATLLKVVNAILDPPEAAGKHRLQQWENGWHENLQLLRDKKTLEAVIPRYFGKHSVVRWAGDFAHAITDSFEYHILSVLVQWAMETWLNDAASIYELGCGPGYHLLNARSLFPDKRLVGLDWTRASQEILQQAVAMGVAQNIHGYNFDFCAPDYELPMDGSVGVYSVAALEQIGDRFEPLLEFLLEKRPRVCIHIEPIDELLDEGTLLDRLSLAYTRKRNYLHGFLSRLRQLESQGRLRILLEQRTWTGSLFLEGHSIVVWSPR